MNVLIAGQKWFGSEVFNSLVKLPNVSITAVVAPPDDRLRSVAEAKGIPVILAGTLCEASMPENIDLIVAAHSHDFVGLRTRLRATFGGIGYHPSLLPIHRGRDAIKWAIRMRERVTGGTVYRLAEHVDGGNIIEQEHVFIRPDDTAEVLWRRDLAPLGVRLISRAVAKFAIHGFIAGTAQEEELATWEPAIGSKPLQRPDLLMIGYDDRKYRDAISAADDRHLSPESYIYETDSLVGQHENIKSNPLIFETV